MADEEVDGLTGNESETTETPEQTEAGEVAKTAGPADRFEQKLNEFSKNQEKLFGKWGNEIGKVRAIESQLNGIQEYLSQLARPVQQEQYRPEPEKEPDITNLNGWVNDVITKREAKMKNEFAQILQQRDLQEARSNAIIGRESFMGDKSKSDLYEGIEDEVTNLVYRSHSSKAI